MGPDPKPDHRAVRFHSERAVMQSHTDRPKSSYTFEMKRWMLGVAQQQKMTLICQAANFVGKLPVASPESGASPVPHRSVQRPVRRSWRASSASASRRPPAISSSICRSQEGASNSANHARNASSSAGVSRSTASSISFTLLICTSLLYTVSRGNWPAWPTVRESPISLTPPNFLCAPLQDLLHLLFVIHRRSERSLRAWP